MKENIKNNLRKDFNKWDLTDDMFFLAEVVVTAEKLLEKEGFPIHEFKRSKGHGRSSRGQ